MAEITTAEIKGFLEKIQGQEVTLDTVRSEFNLLRGTKSFDSVRNIMFQLAKGKARLIKPVGKRQGVYKVIKRVERVNVFGIARENRPPIDLMFPMDRDTEMELPFAESVILKEGSLIVLAGYSNYGKTMLAMNFIAENLDKNPVLMGNEYTDADGEPKQSFMDRLNAMDWVKWTNGNGADRFELLPVHDDFEDNIKPDRINAIDWIDLEDEPWRIKDLCKKMKNAVGRGVVIAVIQKNDDREAGYGGTPSKFYADLELLLDRHTTYESRITVGKYKGKGFISGRSWAFAITDEGTHIRNCREVVKCHQCHGFKYIKGKGACDVCGAVGFINK